MGEKVTRLINAAKALRSKNFGGSQSNQCANFVRAAFKEAGFDPGRAKVPTDAKFIKHGDFADSYADSFAGDEIGPTVPFDRAQAGDIIMFKNTDMSYPSGTITHVGICLDHKTMIDRGGSAVNIREWARWPGTANIVEIRRPNCLKEAAAPRLVYDKTGLNAPLGHGHGVGGPVSGSASHLKSLKLYLHHKLVGGHFGAGSLPDELEVRVKLKGEHLTATVIHNSHVETLRLEALTLEMKSSLDVRAGQPK